MDEGLAEYLEYAANMPGWTLGEEAELIADSSFNMPDDAVIVEIGTFFGAGTILLAGARKLRGSGKVHTVDPFDGSGDAFSSPIYNEIISNNAPMTMREHVDHALAETELTDWVEVHAGTAAEIAATWTKPIDFLFLDADMSPKGARIIYEAWAPFVKPGGWIALHNSDEREYQPDHEGNHLIAVQEFVEPYYIGVETTHSLTFACKV